MGPKKFWVGKNYRPEKKFWSTKNCGSEKNVGTKLWVQKTFGFKKIRVGNKCLKRNFA